MGARPGEAQAVAEPLDGPVMRRYLELARETGMWLSCGGFQEKGPEGDERIFNTHVIINTTGQIVAAYRKIHLFDAPFVGLVESRQALAGDRLVVADSPAGRLGVTICYDMRFPELYQKLAFVHEAQARAEGPPAPRWRSSPLCARRRARVARGRAPLRLGGPPARGQAVRVSDWLAGCLTVAGAADTFGLRDEDGRSALGDAAALPRDRDPVLRRRRRAGPAARDGRGGMAWRGASPRAPAASPRLLAPG